MTKTPTTNVVVPHGIESLAAINAVKWPDLSLRTVIDLNSMLLELGLCPVLDLAKT